MELIQDSDIAAVDETSPSSHFTTRLRRLIPIVMVITGVFFMVTGILINHFKTTQNNTVSSTADNKVSSVAGEMKVKNVMVDISGAVEQPGVYAIPYDSRISNVLITAGGLSPKADRNYISRYINLAQRVSDGMKIYLPFENELSSYTINQLPSNPINFSGLININFATTAELDTLPGVGAVTANKIISARPYQDITELTSKGVVSKSVFEKIKSLISTN